jgi:hypothetical protein
MCSGSIVYYSRKHHRLSELNVWVLWCLDITTIYRNNRSERGVTVIPVSKYIFGNEDEVAVFICVWANIW